MKEMLVVAVHPDDETLGCGGTLLRRQAEGWDIHWLLATAASREGGFPEETERLQQEVVDKVSKAYAFSSVHQLRFPATRLDTVPIGVLVDNFSKIIQAVQASTIILPFAHDPHSDHHCVFTAAYSCTKIFRYPWVKRVLMMETPSETDFTPALPGQGFVPNVFVDITEFVDRKMQILSLYAREIAQHPFPRSLEGCSALSTVRGAAAGCRHAEAFMLLKEVL